jgi:hypothetical protein
MMWRTQTFQQAFERQGYALLSGTVGYVPVSKRSALIIKTPEDLQFADALLKASSLRTGEAIRYDERARHVMEHVTR